MSTAHEYCQNIGRELEALELILSTDIEALRLITTERTAYDNETIEQYNEAVNELDADIELDAYQIVSQYLYETVLEITILRTDDRQQTRVEILRTCGGTRCDISRDNNDGQIISVTTYDGHDQATIRNSYPELSNYLDELAQ